MISSCEKCQERIDDTAEGWECEGCGVELHFACEEPVAPWRKFETLCSVCDEERCPGCMAPRGKCSEWCKGYGDETPPTRTPKPTREIVK